MKTPPPPRKPQDSETLLTLIVLNPQLNTHTGFCDEGQLLHLADDAAYIAAMRHALCKRTNTGATSTFKFLGQAMLNDLVTCHAHVAATGNRSMLVEVKLEMYPPPYTESHLLASGDFVYVLAEADYEPLRVPGLQGKTPEEAVRIEAAKSRLLALKAKISNSSNQSKC